MADEMDRRVNEVEKDLAAHLAECALQHRAHTLAQKIVSDELRRLGNAVWGAFLGSFSVLILIVGLFLKNHLHL